MTAASDRPFEASPAAQPYSSAEAWYLLGILLVAYTLAFIDRTVLALLVQPIQRDLGINDTQLSLLHGLAFAVFYTVFGIPVARLADRRSRRMIIAIGIAVWSLMTAACGLARSFGELFLARMGVGVGEAALSPAAYSMIADSFPPEKLGRAFGIYQIGIFGGGGLAFLIGGTIIQFALSTPSITLPLIGELATWKTVFLIVGLPGLLVGLWVLTAREPPRRQVAAPEGNGFGEVLRFLAHHRKIFVPHFAGFSLAALVFNGFNAWAPVMFVRQFGLGQGEVGQYLGLALLIFGSTGIIAGGWLSDWLTRRNHSSGPIIAALVGVGGSLPFVIAAPLAPSWQLSLLLFCPLFFFAAFPYAGGGASLQMITPGPMRAQVSAIYLFFINILGIGVGPTLIALVTDGAYGDKQMVFAAMAIVGGVVSIMACFALWMLAPRFKAEAARQAAISKGWSQE